MEWNAQNNERNINCKSIQKRRCFTNRREFTSKNKNKHFLKVTPTWSPDKGNMAAIPVPTSPGILKIENFQFWHSLFTDESRTPQWCTWYGTDNLVTPTHTKNSTSFPSNQDRNLFPLIHRNNKSNGTVNAYHLKWKVKIRNKLLDIWNWKTDLQRITGINNTWKIP